MKTRILLVTMTMVLSGAAMLAADKGVARIDGVTISEEELSRATGTKLMRVRSEEYLVKSQVLDELIADKLIAAEAKKRGVSANELLEAEVNSKATPPSDADLETMYEGMRERFGGMTKEQAIAEMRDRLKARRAAERKDKFVQELRNKAGVEVFLEPPRIEIAAVGPSKGSENAPITIVEFSDYECQFCGRAAETLRTIVAHYGDNVRLVYRDYPLQSHRGAQKAAEAAHCAAEQDKYWDMHDKLFAKGGAIARADLSRFARELALDTAAFETCVDSNKYKSTWQRGLDDGIAVGVRSTPTFFVNGRLFAGAASFESFQKVIDEELARGKKTAGVKSASK